MYAKIHIGRAEREILAPVVHINYFFKSPMYMAFPTAADPTDRYVGPLSPLPCQAWHGYGVSSAHHGEVRGNRRAYERTPLRGRRRCAAGGRPLHQITLEKSVGKALGATLVIHRPIDTTLRLRVGCPRQSYHLPREKEKSVCKAPGATLAPPSFQSYLAFSLPMLSTGFGVYDRPAKIRPVRT
jgi:hypothetical protein